MTKKDNRSPLAAFININEKRWENIERKLHNIADRIAALNPASAATCPSVRDIVVCADPRRPPHSLKFYAQQLSKKFPLFTSVHAHSSVTRKIPGELMDFLSDAKSSSERSRARYVLTLIWKEAVPHLPSVMADPGKPAVSGEVNVGRFLARIIEDGVAKSETLSATALAKQNEMLDRIHGLSCGGGNGGKLAILKNVNGFLCGGNDPTIADVHLLSLAKQNGVKSSELDSYVQRCVATKPELSICC